MEITEVEDSKAYPYSKVFETGDRHVIVFTPSGFDSVPTWSVCVDGQNRPSPVRLSGKIDKNIAEQMLMEYQGKR